MDTARPNSGRKGRARITVRDVRASYKRGDRDCFYVIYIARPIADLITPSFYNAGWSANGLTILRIVISCFALLGLLLADPIIHVLVVATFYLCFVLDCVDGNLSRLNDSASYYGKFIDGLADALFIFFTPLFAGAGLWLNQDMVIGLLLGAATTTVALTTQCVQTRFSFIREWMTNETGPLTQEQNLRLAGSTRVLRMALSLMENTTFFALLLLLPPLGPIYYVGAVAIVLVGSNTVVMGAVLAQAKIVLQRHRRSRHAATV